MAVGIPSQTIHLDLLGHFVVRVGRRTIERLPRKTVALLAYLAIEQGSPVSRETVANLLWTDHGAEQAFHSLRQALLVLRREFGPHGPLLRLKQGMLSLAPSVTCDAAILALHCRSERVSELEHVEPLYRGRLLAGLSPVAPGFDAWLDAQRDALDKAVLAALDRLVGMMAAIGDHARAVTVAERMVSIDPLREDLHRRLIIAYLDAGRRGDALRQYETCCQTMRRELDVPVSAETRLLFQRLRSDEDNEGVVGNLPAAGPPRLAVLPFRTLTPETVPTYFAEGMTEDIIGSLAALREPVVIAYGSTLDWCGKAADPREVSAILGVRYVVSGTLRRAGARFRVSAQLADCDSGAVLWAGSRDVVEGNDLFEAQDELTLQIVNAIVPALHAAELRRLSVKQPRDMTAYELVLQARELIYRLERPDFERAGSLLRQAVARDSAYANAWALLAEWHGLRVGQGLSDNPAADVAAVDRFARTAVENDATNGRALAFHGHSQAYLWRDYDAALGLFDRALEASPNDSATWTWSSPTLAYTGDGTAAIRHAERGLRLSPRDRFIFRSYAALCLAHYTHGDHEAAVHWGRLAAQANPAYTSNLRVTAAALVALGRTTEAHGWARQVLASQPDFTVRKLMERHPYRDRDRRQRLGKQLIAAGLPP